MVSESPSGQSQAPCGPPTAGVATDAVRGRAPGDAGPAPAKADLSSAGQVGARAPEALGLAPRNDRPRRQVLELAQCRQPGLELADDRSEDAGGEES